MFVYARTAIHAWQVLLVAGAASAATLHLLAVVVTTPGHRPYAASVEVAATQAAAAHTAAHTSS
jgi:hypothetical protein